MSRGAIREHWQRASLKARPTHRRETAQDPWRDSTLRPFPLLPFTWARWPESPVFSLFILPPPQWLAHSRHSRNACCFDEPMVLVQFFPGSRALPCRSSANNSQHRSPSASCSLRSQASIWAETASWSEGKSHLPDQFLGTLGGHRHILTSLPPDFALPRFRWQLEWSQHAWSLEFITPWWYLRNYLNQ